MMLTQKLHLLMLETGWKVYRLVVILKVRNDRYYYTALRKLWRAGFAASENK